MTFTQSTPMSKLIIKYPLPMSMMLKPTKSFQILVSLSFMIRNPILLPSNFTTSASFHGAHRPSNTNYSIWTFGFKGLPSSYSIVVSFLCNPTSQGHWVEDCK
ncbi:hypothetical protein AAZX31_09G107500 [Glycine max]